MPKHEKGTPKEIANRCKSKGLQKLRWYCEMCHKQCRDQNGFKCHLTSESHQRQLLLFAENPHQYLNEYSNDFRTSFLKLLKTAHGTTRVRANEVYQEYIRDKGHIHMNSTVWHSLTRFIQWLGKENICHVDLTEKGWFIAYIDKEAEMKKEEAQRKSKAEKIDGDRHIEAVEAQRIRAEELQGETAEYQPTELRERDQEEKVAFSIGNSKPTSEMLAKPTPALLALSGSIFERQKREMKKEVKEESKERDQLSRRERSRSRDDHRTRSKHRSRSRENGKRESSPSEPPNQKRPKYDNRSKGSTSKKEEKVKKSAMEDIREAEERRKEFQNRKDYWITPGIVVKIVTKELGPEFYKLKGVVKSNIDDYTASVRMENGFVVKLDQSHVETVIPAIGREMFIVNGAYRGQKATLNAILEESFSLRVTISEGPLRGRTLTVPYEDASKLA